MDRNIVYPGSIPLDTDILTVQQNVMKAIGALVQTVMGTSTFADGLACTQTLVPSMSVLIAQGWLGSLQTVDPNAYGSLDADGTTPLMKMGINLAATQLGPLAAPATAGQSVVYLVQAAFSEVDGTPVVLPYYNSANPSQPYTGPNNSGTSQNTKRAQTVTLQLKQGAAATSGSQVTPAPDSGFVGLHAITIANGQTTITAPDISVLPAAPFVQYKIPSLTPGFSHVITFLSTTSWTVPDGVKLIRVKLWAAGGSGGGTIGSLSAASGATAGAYAEGIYSVTPGQVITVTVGQGGAVVAGAASGNPGGNSSFGAFLSALGGPGGFGANGTIQNAAPAASTASGGTILNVLGTGGGTGTDLGGSGFGGNGGATWQSSIALSTGGGTFPGGGGAGGCNGLPGGPGANGLVMVEY